MTNTKRGGDTKPRRLDLKTILLLIAKTPKGKREFVPLPKNRPNGTLRSSEEHAAYAALWYVKNVVKKPWPLGEATVKQSILYHALYDNWLRNGPKEKEGR